MTTPDDAVPVEPVVTPDEAAAQAAAQEAAAASAAQTDAIRALAAEIAKQTLLDFDPATLRKGVIASITAGSPPTVGITISGDTTEIPGVRYFDHYLPVVADVVHVIKQGTDLIVLGKVAEAYVPAIGWTKATLGSGFTHDGNSNGDVQYRRVFDNGSWKVQWKGGAARSSGIAVISAALPSEFRPASRRSFAVRRNADGGSSVVGLDFEPSGIVNMNGGTTAPSASTNAVDPGDTSAADPGDTSSTGSHTHLIDLVNVGSHTHSYSHTHQISSQQPPPTTASHHHGGITPSQSSSTTGSSNLDANGNAAGNGIHSHTMGTHVHTMGTHSHTVSVSVDDPTWISLNGLSYYLDD